MLPRRWLPAVALLALARAAAGVDAGPCPGPASIAVVADNLSSDASVTLHVEGQLVDPGATCSGAGVTSYATTLDCAGPGATPCGHVDGLRPGAWVHRVRAQVAGSDEQAQSQRSMVLVGTSDRTSGGTNTVSWTVYPRTFIVRAADGGALRDTLDAAAAFTAAAPGARALVTFDPDVFPGPDHPQTILLESIPRSSTGDICPDDVHCPDGRSTSYCLTGSNVVVDALDARGALPGGVILSVNRCTRSVLRIMGSDNVLRGLELHGSANDAAGTPLDTLAISGAGAQRNRVEHCIIRGPTNGDAVEVEDGAGSVNDNVVERSEITGAADKGIKVTTGGHVRVADSCVHDNSNGGIQATDGGNVVAVRNVVQLNRPGASQNGLLVGVPDQTVPMNTMTTDGNVIRFSGARGISVVNAASATFMHDVVTDNQQAGAVVESAQGTTPVPPETIPSPEATFRGVAFDCNYKQISGTCDTDKPAGVRCGSNDACPSGVQCAYEDSDGAGLRRSSCDGCAVAHLDLGAGGRDSGRDAFTQNQNPRDLLFGINLSNRDLDPWGPIVARGNQWEHCGTGTSCNVGAVLNNDVRPHGVGADVGTPTGPGRGPAPVIARVVPARPHAGDFVRVYNASLDGSGGTFNAIDGAACTDPGVDQGRPVGLPGDACSPENPNVVAQNRSVGRANRVAITMGQLQIDAEVHAVTPSMLIFRMPVDCYAPASMVVTRGNDSPSAPFTLCDPGSCADQPAGTACDDGNVCGVDQRCDGNGACVPTSTIQCVGPCLTGACDPRTGCVVAATDPTCNDGNPCTADVCVAAGTCESVSHPDGTACPAVDACHGAGSCHAGACDAGAPLPCSDGDFCTEDVCDPAAGCLHPPVTGLRRSSCRVDALRALLASLPDELGGLSRRLLDRLDRADKALAKAGSARPKKRRSALQKARRHLRTFVQMVRTSRRVGGALEHQLTDTAKAAIAMARPAA
jgi:hypothetical protein